MPRSTRGTPRRRVRPGPPRRRRQRAGGPASAVALREQAKLRVAAFVVVLAASTLAGTVMGHAGDSRVFAVATESMEPTIPRGALVFVEARQPGAGEVVVYRSVAGVAQVHRVEQVREDAGERRYLTRGDANEAPDAFLVPEARVLGVVVAMLPTAGWPWLLPQEVQVAVFLAAATTYLALVAWEVRNLLGLGRVRAWLAATGLALVLVAPGGLGATTLHWPASPLIADVATTPLPMAQGAVGGADIAADSNNATAVAPPSRLWAEGVLWACRSAGKTCPLATGHTTFTSELGSRTLLDTAKWAPLPTFHFEVVLKAPAGRTVYARLYNLDDAAAVAGSEVSTTDTTPTRLRSAAITLATGAKEYAVQTRISATGAGSGELHAAKILTSQDVVGSPAPHDTYSMVRLAAGGSTNSESFTAPMSAALWRYDGDRMDGVVDITFEVVMNISDDDEVTELRLMDRTTASEVFRMEFPKRQFTVARFRETGLQGTLVDGHEYDVEFRTQHREATIHLYMARMLIHQQSFTKTVRVVDLSHEATTTSASFTAVGYDAAYQMYEERGNRTAVFEATLRGSAAGTTASAQLFDRTEGQAVAGSQVGVTGTTRARVRSAEVNLNAANATYAAELKAAGGGTAEVRNAWVLVFQEPGKWHDDVLRSRNDVAPVCTWSFTLTHTGSSGLARLDEATVAIRGDGALQHQLRVVAGSLTQSTGQAALVPGGTSLSHVVFTKPNASGTSTLDADLEGTCQGSGIHTVQRVTYSFR